MLRPLLWNIVYNYVLEIALAMIVQPICYVVDVLLFPDGSHLEKTLRRTQSGVNEIQTGSQRLDSICGERRPKKFDSASLLATGNHSSCSYW